MPSYEWTSFEVDGEAVRAHLSLPDAASANGSGVVVVHGSNGLEAGFLVFPARLAELGYAVVLPDMFHRVPNYLELDPPARLHALTVDGSVEDLSAALALLRGRGVGRVAVLGYCFGGSLALMAPATLDFVTGVMYYPHGLFVPFGTGPTAPADVVPQVRVPMLGHFGAEDRNPSPADRERLDAALSAAQVPHRLYSYDGAPHGFAVKNEGRPNFRAAQAQAAHDCTVDWFERHLRATGVLA